MKVVLNEKINLQTHQIFSDLHKFSKGHLGSEGVILLVLGMGALEALVIRHCKWMAACILKNIQSKSIFLVLIYHLHTSFARDCRGPIAGESRRRKLRHGRAQWPSRQGWWSNAGRGGR